MDPQPELSDGRVLLRPWRPGDAAAVAAACEDAAIQRWTSVPSPYRRSDAEAFVGEWAPQQWTSGRGAAYAVVQPDADILIGAVGLGRRDPVVRSAEIGYWTAPAARGRGHTTAAVRLLTRFGFDTLGLARIEWYAEVGNAASRRVAARAGFTVEGTLRAKLPHSGGLVDAWVGARLATDPDRPAEREVPQPVLHTGRLTLRPFEPADAPAVAAACADPGTQAWLPLPSPYTLGHAEQWVSVGAFADRYAGTGVHYAVAENLGGVLVGDIGLKRLDRAAAAAEVGYWTAPAARGRGYMTEAVGALCRWAYAELGLRRVELRAAPANTASRRVAAKAGFRMEGVLRAAGYLHTGPVDLVCYSRLVDDPPN